MNGIYSDGTYLEHTGGTWHVEDSPFKAKWIARLLARHSMVDLHTVCEIGCGGGAILHQLEGFLPDSISFTGYDISPEAHEISKQFVSSRCRFVLGDAFADSNAYDLVLAIDVIEHVEDCFSFLRSIKAKGKLKIYHIPIDVHVSSVLRGSNLWDVFGHLHLFTMETAVKALEYTGHRIIDSLLTDGAVEAPKFGRTRLLNLLRRPVGIVNRRLSAKLFGGYSLLALAE